MVNDGMLMMLTDADAKWFGGTPIYGPHLRFNVRPSRAAPSDVEHQKLPARQAPELPRRSTEEAELGEGGPAFVVLDGKNRIS